MNASSMDPSNSGDLGPAENGDESDAGGSPDTSQDAAGPPPTDDPAAHQAAQAGPDPVEPPD